MFEKLKLFIEIAKAGSISQAAENLYISQSSVSAQLKALENEVGAPLFDRAGRGVKLNRKGEFFLEFAKNTLQSQDTVLQIIHGKDEQQAHKLTICAGGYFNVHFLPLILPLFTKENNDVDINTITSYSDDIILDVEQKKYEFGIVGTDRPVYSPHLHTDFSYTAPLLFVCSSLNPLATREIVNADDLRDEVFIFTRVGSNYRNYLEDKMAKNNLTFSGHIAHSSMEAIKAAVAKNLGVTILPQHVVEREIKSKELANIKIEGVTLTRIFCCIHNIEQPLSPISQRFIDLCIQVLDQQDSLTNNFLPSEW